MLLVLVDEAAVLDGVTVDGNNTISVVTPAVTVDMVVAELVPLVVVVVVVPLLQKLLYQFSSNCLSLAAGQLASHVPSGEVCSWVRSAESQKQFVYID